jgi:glycosyltransferase involved in cell wall biosynthesis
MDAEEVTSMEQNPFISIVMPTYNRSRLITRSIESVLRQSYRTFELIIVDDASTDDTESVVGAFSDERLRYIKHKKNRGANAARNTGIRASSGNYIAFQDSDDEWLPEKLNMQVECLRKFAEAQNVGVIYTSFYQVRGNVRKYYPDDSVVDRDGWIFESLLCGRNFVTSQAALVKRECFDEVGFFDETLPRLQDWEMWLRISKRYVFIHLDKPLVIAYLSEDSITMNLDPLFKAHKIIMDKYHADICKRPRIAGCLYFQSAYCLKALGRIKEARGPFRIAFKYHPSFKYFCALIFSYMGCKYFNLAEKIYKNMFPFNDYQQW